MSYLVTEICRNMLSSPKSSTYQFILTEVNMNANQFQLLHSAIEYNSIFMLLN